MTAVEWLIQEHFWGIENCTPDFRNKIEQAKEMEKKIIARAFEDGEYNYFYSKKTGEEFDNGIEYYNEKFKPE